MVDVKTFAPMVDILPPYAQSFVERQPPGRWSNNGKGEKYKVKPQQGQNAGEVKQNDNLLSVALESLVPMGGHPFAEQQ